MRMKLTMLLLAALIPIGSTSYSAPQVPAATDLRVLAAEAVRATLQGQQGERGARAELRSGQPAPFAGVLLDAEALAVLREEVEALRAEAAALRAANEQLKLQADFERGRAELWQAEAKGSGWQQFTRSLGLYGSAACLGAGLAVWAGGQ